MSIKKDRWSAWRKATGATVLVAVIVALPVWAYAWSAARMGPTDLPVGIAGPVQAREGLGQRLAVQGDAFQVRRYPNEAAARTAIENREVYGAVSMSPDGMTLLTASAASPLVAQLLEQAVAPTAATGGESSGDHMPVQVVDVVPADPHDPRQAALGSSVLPLVIVSVLTGLIVMSLTRPGSAQASALLGVAVLSAVISIGIVQGWLGILQGNGVVNAGVLGLTILSISSVVTGLSAWLGHGGLLLAVPLMVFLGNPFSAVSSAPELLPQPAGVIGQMLPPGAGANLLRSTAFFDGAGSAGPLTVLVAWAGLGLCAVFVGALRRRQTAPVIRQALQPVTTR